MKKHLSLLLSVVLAGTALAGCTSDKTSNDPAASKPSDNFNESGFPIVKNELSLRVFNRQSPTNAPWQNMLVFQEYEKMTNMKMKFENVPTAGFVERRNLTISTNDLPDLFISANFSRLDAVKYGSTGIIIPLEGLIDKYAPNIKALFEKYPEIKEALTAPDGHIYMLSDFVTLFSARTAKQWVNKTWLDKVGLAAPKSTEDLKKVLKAFKEKDPNGNGKPDEIPISGEKINNIISNLNGAWGLENQMGYSINVDNDKVRVWLTDDRYKELLQYLRDLYKDGLIDPDIFTQQEADYIGKISSGQVGYFYRQATDSFSKVADQFTGIAPLVGPHGDQKHTLVQPIARSYGAFAITSVNKNPEATIRWIDYFASEKGSIFLRYGVEGKTFNYSKDGEPIYADSILNNEKGRDIAISQFAPWPGSAIPHWINDKNSNAVNPPQVQEAAKKLEPFIPKKILGAPIFDPDTSTKLDTLRTDIDKYVDESAAKFITGALSFDKWNDYVATMKKMGIDEVEKTYQKAYDTVYKKK